MAEQRRRRRRSSSRSKRPPWHFWGVGFAALVLTFGIASAYLLSQMGHEAYMSQYSAQELAYFDSYPLWYDAIWAIGAWSGLIAAVLLLVRLRFALHAFGVALAATCITTFWSMTRQVPDTMNTQLSWIVTGVIIIALILLVMYSRRMIEDKVLR